jgi:putative oxidoreductase
MFEFERRVETSWTRAQLTKVLSVLPRVAVGVLFVFIGYTKFNDDPRGEWYQVFERIGLGQWFRYFTGVVQIAGGILITVRRTRTVGTAMLACTMVGAAFVDVFIVRSPLVIVPLLLLFVIATVWVMSE